MSIKTLFGIAVVAALVFATPARAGKLAGPDKPWSKFFGVSVGVKGGGGGNFLTEPDSPLDPNRELPFESGAGGWGAGGGLYTEFRVLRGFLGLEFDLLFDHSENWCTVQYNGTFDTEWKYSFTAMRIPLLLEGNLEMEKTRVGIGFGPEFVVGLSEDTELTLEQEIPQGPLLRQNYLAKAQTDTMLCFALGLDIKVWKLAISIDLRYAYNVSQPGEYEDRVDGILPVNGGTVIASNSMDLRILLGLAYEFGFDKK